MRAGPATAGISLVCIAPGALLGCLVGSKVDAMALPQTVAAFHSLVGFAAMITSIAVYVGNPATGFTLENISALLGNCIGSIALTGSVVAFGKLAEIKKCRKGCGLFDTKALNLP